MKGVTSDLAARAIMRSCREKFPAEKREERATRELSNLELNKLTGRGGQSSFVDYFRGDIYNGNANVTVTQVLISVTTLIGGKLVSQTYLNDVDIKPLKTADLFFKIVAGDKNAPYSWAIVGARGY